MWKNTRPWLRYIEGIDGAQAGSGGTPAPPEPQQPAPAQPEKGGDQNGDKSSGDEPPAPAPEPVVTPPEPAGDSEPPANAAKPDTDDSRDTELEAMRQQLKELSEWRDKEVARARDAMAADVAKAAGLPDVFASRLRGDSREQLEADAKEIAAVIGQVSSRGAVDPSQGRSGGPVAATIEDAIKAHYGIN